MDEGTKNTSYDHISVGTDPYVLADQTKYVSEGLEIVLTQPKIEKGESSTAINGDNEEASTAIHGDKEEASNTIKLEDLVKLTLQWGLPEEFLSLPTKVELAQAKLKTLDALPRKGAKEVYFVTGDGRHIYLFEKQINNQKKLEEKAKAEAAKHEGEVRKAEPINLLGLEDFVTIEDLKDFSNVMLYTVQEIFFRRHQGPGVDDHAKTFSSLLLAEVDKRNLNPLKQMRTIEQLRQYSVSDAEVPSALALQVLRILGSIFTSMYAAKVYKAGKRLLYAKRNKAISLGKCASKVSREISKDQQSNEGFVVLGRQLVGDDNKDDETTWFNATVRRLKNRLRLRRCSGESMTDWFRSDDVDGGGWWWSGDGDWKILENI
nr:hypothetical protein [Tanacetum cinerariifolium]